MASLQDRRLGASSAERRELSIGLIREWFLSATQLLVDDVGSEEALSHLKPYFINTGMAGAHNIPTFHGMDFEEGTANLQIIPHMWPMVTNGRLSNVFLAEDRSGIYEISGCGTKGRSKEACICVCQFTLNAGVGEARGWELILDKSISYGDPTCHLLINAIGNIPKVAPIDSYKIPQNEIPPIQAESVWEFLALSYIGEAWSNATRALIDCVGSERMMAELCSQVRKMGISFTKRFTGDSVPYVESEQAIISLIDQIQKLHQRKGSISKMEGTLSDCPFSSSPHEICLQYEAFFNGICEAIDSSYEFKYDRMMTKGDKTCHWVVRKKGEATKERAKEETPSDDLVMRLAQKLIDGEITEEEFERKMALLKKHSVVK
jgi:hypothetical protein